MYSLQDFKDSISIVAHSISEYGELISFTFDFPEAKLAEIRTHRMVSTTIDTQQDAVLSLNIESSRAEPIGVRLGRVDSGKYYVPLWTGKKSGMQGVPIDSEKEISDLNTLAKMALKDAVNTVKELDYRGIHKQDANLYLLPFSIVKVLCTCSVEYLEHFFELRTADGVYPVFREMMRHLKEMVAQSKPKVLSAGDGHIAFEGFIEEHYPDVSLLSKSMISASLAARWSFGSKLNVETLTKHQERVLKLAKDKHASVFEHQYIVPKESELEDFEVKVKDGKLVKGKYHNPHGLWIPLRRIVKL